MSKSLDRRKDVRSEAQFKQDIKEASERETMLIKLWYREMVHRGHHVTYRNNGVDNSGEFVEKSDNRPDYQVTVDGESYLLEVKSNPYDHKQTFKIFDLESYVKLGAKILLFFGLGKNKQDFDKETTRWGIIEPKAMEWMLAGKNHVRGDAKWGYKPVIVIYPRDYEGYFKTEELTHIKEEK